MQYGILLWPHMNNRYQDAIKPLGLSELSLVLGDADVAPRHESIAGVDAICFESALSPDEIIPKLADLAHLYLLLQMNADGSFIPLSSGRSPYLGADLPSVLKYKGKTNEVFTHYLINMALYASAFADAPVRLKLIDPMCGRATALFDAVNRGWDAFGADLDRADIHEADVFFKRYLTFHKFKHTTKEMSMTLKGKRSLLRKQFRFANAPEAFKAGDMPELSLICADAADALSAFPRKSFHLAVMDLPYGVQHSAATRGKPESVEKLLSRVLPALRESLLPGGAVAISFNVHNLPLTQARALLSDAGFDVMQGGAFDGLSHWV
ncbi:hypothetical protein LJC33_05200, partial [Eubacteriales bacterium OttesenSCG-928-N13]|nr:hypothetical protein [Eubacteriales bacterium OttesenSCG-928-N13]